MSSSPYPPDLAWLRQIRLTEVFVHLRPDRPYKLPPQPAVMLRGALGLAMFEAACTREDRRCEVCDHQTRCPIPTWFAPHRVDPSKAPPYILAVRGRTASPEDPVRARLVLLGETPRPDLLCAALTRCAQAGLGPDRIPHVVEKIFARGDGVGAVMLRDGADLGRWPQPAKLLRWVHLPPEPPSAIRLTLRTPLSIKRGRTDVPPPARILAELAVQRVRFIARQLDQRLQRRWPSPDDLQGRWTRSKFIRAERFSKRQNGPHDLSGWTGEILIDRPAPFLDAFLAAETLHLGRSTTAGLGQITVEPLE